MKNMEFQGFEAIKVPAEDYAEVERIIRESFVGWQPPEYGDYPFLGGELIAVRAYSYAELTKTGFCLPDDQNIPGHHSATGTFNWSRHVRSESWDRHFSVSFNKLAGTDYCVPFTNGVYDFVNNRHPQISEEIRRNSWFLEIPVVPYDILSSRSLWHLSVGTSK
jgi:hypothetical protein